MKARRVNLADSALDAPRAGFGDADFYSDLYLDLNGCRWVDGQPDVDEAVDAMFTVAAREVDEAWLAGWLGERVSFPT
jgi:death-on-curing protein